MKTRRQFLKTYAAAATGPLILKSGLLAKGNSPNEKLNIAFIGVGGRAKAHFKEITGENVVALCDVDSTILADTAKEYPGAKTYSDWRKCLEQKDIDAVVCSTTDHTHAFVNIWAMNRGKHVYSEKPLANSVHEARMVRETYLKYKGKIATQMGTQMHSTENARRVVEMIRGGAIGVPKEVRVWCSRRPEGGSYYPAEGEAPANLNWDLWIGPSQMHPYNSGYIRGCLKWNRFWDFGSGQIGDMGSHMMDWAFWALDLRFPTSCEAQGTPVNSDTCPTWLTAVWDHPANDWRPAVKVYWYDGGKKPGMPSKIFHQEPEPTEGDVRGAEGKDPLFKGLVFKGDKGFVMCDYGWRLLLPSGDMTHYKSPKPEDLIPMPVSHQQEWVQACKTGSPTGCNFDYSGAEVEHNLLALVAYRTGKKLQWDAQSLKATNCPEAEQYITKKYRDGWTLNG
ncbi:MAG TPA: Gfo/Idh/MocA family oxidoreductase [Verrucomicrobiae bacterium]|nr:Gfo/Idh/MocA family oxidoreductase [Verrucomicrobiae bacterium]